ncbi:MAG TPA: exodeoxyribonuclease VII large subunit [Lichenihabitans sp.]|jgi:exodeoxyribonuclease VII large subunit|nr:exodeoxyribonuclease VII large subunit [Lichenihabitans sp.]
MRSKSRTATSQSLLAEFGAGSPPGGDLLANAPEFSVSELSGALKRTVEDRFGYVRVRGEVSNYRGPHSSGHAYFSLKDATARIDAVVWRTAFGRMRIKPEEGMEVVATGKITTFPGKSSYQIVIETLEPAGIGALMAMLEERRRRFAAEGLFDAARKRPLPFLPRVIGVVTSPTGAVIRDILHRVSARFPRHVLVWPVRVQGEDSAVEVARAIRGFNALSAGGSIAVPDLLIVARGGGSLEDLWGFNEEAVIRAAGESRIPLVSAVGHETDWTLLDHVADLRAPTPTGAAELAVPVRAELVVALDRLGARHGAGALRLMERSRDRLRALVRALPAGADLLADPRQRLDQAGARLPAGFRIGADCRRLALVRLAGGLAAQSPRARLERSRQKLDAAAMRLERAGLVAAERRRHRLASAAARLEVGFKARLALIVQDLRARRARLDALMPRLTQATATASSRRRERLGGAAKMLASLGYRSVLGRGYALVRDAAGLPLRRAADAPPGTVLSIDVDDGALRATVLGGPGIDAPAADLGRTETAKRPRGRAAPRILRPAGSGQGSLF